MFTQPTQIPRSPLASTLTLLFHVCLMLAAIAMSAVPRVLPAIAGRESLTYVTTAPLPALEFERPPAVAPEPAPRVDAPAPEPPTSVEVPVIEKRPVAMPEPIAKAPPPAPEPVAEPTRPAPEPVAEPTRPAPEPISVPPPVPEPPPVVLGAFADARSPRDSPERTLTIADAGFAVETAEAARARRRMAVVEGFDTAPREGTRPDRPAGVADAGFGGRTERAATGRIATTVGEAGFAAEQPAHDGAPGPRRIASTGFAEAAAAHPLAPAMPRAAAAPAGFTETPAAGRPAAATPARARADTPVEILYKPTPAYSDEARALGVEGEVSIEVTFTAGGQVRVVRVARGLGYGLDDMARHAAERIRFTPATRGGVPVDVHTTLTIVFRLT